MSQKTIKTKLPPTLIVGLGGTGCDIISRVYKLSTEEQRKYLRFVYFDTDANELRIRKEESPYAFTVQTSQKMTVGQALRSDSEARENSFPTSNQLLNKPLTEGAGQVRAVSKLAFDSCLRDGRIEPLHDAIDELQHLNGDVLEQSMRVVIVSTLVGGTGSGIVLPVAMYLRKYLENICRKKPLIRGICVLPDVFFRGGNKTEVEKNNLRANAYAALRELDAFMLKADSSHKNGIGEKFWLKMPTPGTVNDYDDYSVNPMDFCFLYDGLNMDGDGLNNFEAYKQHISDCVYASSVSMLNKRLNSSEDNTILARCEENGRNRYCGVGSSKIVYPFTHVRDYLAMTWMNDSISSEWLRYDKKYEEDLNRHQADRKKGKLRKQKSLRDFYNDQIYADKKEKDAFASVIYNQSYTKDADGVICIEPKWISYYRELISFISKTVSDDKKYDNGCSDEIDSELDDLRYLLTHPNDNKFREIFDPLINNLKKYDSLTRKRSESIASAIADSLFSNYNFNPENKERIEYWLRDENQYIHPNSVRFFLYGLEKTLKESYIKLTSPGSFKSFFPNSQGEYTDRRSFVSIDDDISSFFDVKKYTRPSYGKTAENVSKNESSQDISIEEYGRSIDVKKFFDEGNLPLNEWRVAVEEIIEDCEDMRSNIQRYYKSYLEKTIIEKALEFVGQLCDNYEHFYRQLDSEIKRLPHRINRIEGAFVNDSGDPVIYACASKQCMQGMAKRCPNIVDSITLTPEFCEALYESVYESIKEDNKEKQLAVINKVVDTKILEFWRAQVVEMYGKKVDMDVIDALITQAEIEEGIFEPKDQFHYIKGKRESAMKLAAPFIDKPIGIEPYIIEAIGMSDEVASEEEDVQKADIIKNIFTGHEKDVFLDKYQLLFMKALYNLRIGDLPKFAPEDDFEVDPVEKGSYYKSYWKRINGVIPDDKKTPILTPHLDKRWHYVGVMPDLSEKTEIQCYKDAHAALLASIAYGKVIYDIDRFRFISGSSEANGDYIDDNIIVGDGTCNNFSEIYEAMLMSRPLVLNFLELHKKSIKEEKQESLAGRTFRDNHLYKNIKRMCITGKYEHNISFLELPILYKVTAAGNVRSDSESLVMLSNIIEFVENYLSEFYSDVNVREKYFIDWMSEQTKLMFDNLRSVYPTMNLQNVENDPLVRRIKNSLESKIKNSRTKARGEEVTAGIEKYLSMLEINFAVDTPAVVNDVDQ